ncbi:MAG: hypothetical protein ABJA83_15460 [Burkholderiaceae bacterium]
MLWTLRPEPLPLVVATAPAQPKHVPGRSLFAFGSGPAVVGPESVAEPAVSGALSQSGPAPVPQAVTLESPAAQRARFDNLRWFGTDAAELTALAREMDAALPSIVRAGAMEPGDALALKADLLDVIEFNPMRRRDLLVEWWNAHPLTSQARDPRHPASKEDLRRELAALAEWQAQRSEDRDTGELEEKLEDLSLRPTRRP